MGTRGRSGPAHTQWLAHCQWPDYPGLGPWGWVTGGWRLASLGFGFLPTHSQRPAHCPFPAPVLEELAQVRDQEGQVGC